MLESLHLLRPLWLLAFIPMALLAAYWIKTKQSVSGWENAIDDHLLNVLLDDAPKRANRWLRWFLLTGAAVAVIGLSGPTWERLPQNVEQKNDALIMVLDLSLSMLAQDVKPSRVERARQKITDVLRQRNEGQTALIAYAGDAHAVVPLTDDTATITNLLVALSPEMMPVFGSNPDAGLELAHDLFQNSYLTQGRILLITDGIDNVNSVTQHQSRAFPISVLAVGTAQGGPIPLDKVRQPGRFLTTDSGRQVIAKLDEKRLQNIAESTYGNYAKAEVGDADINHVLSSPLPSEDDSIEVEREFDTWVDQGHWAALLLLPLVLLCFRRGLFVIVCLALWLPALPTQANALIETWDSLWLRDDQRGYQALRDGDAEQAVMLFDNDSQWQSVAQYRSGDYSSSLRGFRDDATVTGRYNEANSLARLGDYAAAIERYDQVLSVQPAHEDALFNKALVEQLLEQQQSEEQQNENQDNQNQDSENEDGEQQPQDASEQEQESDQSDQEEPQNEPEQESSQPEEQTAQAQQEETQRDEQQDALEQWLRRVPDDPGGLLRRKFSHETKQRLRRGERVSKQGDKVW